jgi:hypothetical protein
VIDSTPAGHIQPYPDLADPAPLDIPISALRLQEVGKAQPWHCLRSTLTIGGRRFHVCAIAIGAAYDAEAAELRRHLGDLRRAFLEEGPFTFSEVPMVGSDGKEHGYAIFIHPEDWFT